LDWGGSAERIKAAAEASGHAISQIPFLENEPQLQEHLFFEWRAFSDLSRDRQSGFSTGRIPWTSFDRYAVREDINGDDFRRFVYLMCAMDEAFLSNIEEKRSKT
jgi:hypothetical protein